MLWLLGARIHRVLGSLCEVRVPLEVLSAVDATPEEVRVHYSADEVGIIAMRGAGVEWSSSGGRCYRGVAYGECQQGDELHVDEVAVAR